MSSPLDPIVAWFTGIPSWLAGQPSSVYLILVGSFFIALGVYWLMQSNLEDWLVAD